MSTRQHKTPRQRAEEALAVEERRVKKLTTKRDHLRIEQAAVQAELEAATARRDYLAKHPDLTPTPGTSTTHPSTPGGTTRS